MALEVYVRVFVRACFTGVCCMFLCSQIKTHEQVNRMEIYEKTVEVLGPEVAKAKDLMRFVNSASARSG